MKQTTIITVLLVSVLSLTACPAPNTGDAEPIVYTAQSVSTTVTPWNTPSTAFTLGAINYNTNIIRTGTITSYSIAFEGDNGIAGYALCTAPGTYWFKFTNFVSGYPDLEFYICTDFTVNGVTYHFKDYTDSYGVSISTKELYDSDGTYIGALTSDDNELLRGYYSLDIQDFIDSIYYLKVVVTSVESADRIFVWANQERDRIE